MESKNSMRLNRELRTNNMKVRFHVLWFVFYIILVGGFIASAILVYRQHSENQFPSGSISLNVGKERYKLGEEVTFSVRNQFPSTIYVANNCPEEPLNVYRWDKKKWEQIHAKAKGKNTDCHKQPRQIAIQPNSTREYNFGDWPSLFADPGVYRIAMKIDHSDELAFSDFVVLRPAKVIKKPNPINQTSPTAPAAPAEAPKNTEEKKEEAQNEEEPEDENEIEEDDD